MKIEKSEKLSIVRKSHNEVAVIDRLREREWEKERKRERDEMMGRIRNNIKKERCWHLASSEIESISQSHLMSSSGAIKNEKFSAVAEEQKSNKK